MDSLDTVEWQLKSLGVRVWPEMAEVCRMLELGRHLVADHRARRVPRREERRSEAGAVQEWSCSAAAVLSAVIFAAFQFLPLFP
jgi:hypothetical protein